MSSQAIQLSVPSIKDGEAQPADITQLLFGRALSSRRSVRSLACRDRSCSFRWCGRQLSLRNMPISGIDPTPRPAAVYASNAALPRRPQDSLPSCLLGFGRTRLALASSHQLLLSHPASRLIPSNHIKGFISGVRRSAVYSEMSGPSRGGISPYRPLGTSCAARYNLGWANGPVTD